MGEIRNALTGALKLMVTSNKKLAQQYPEYYSYKIAIAHRTALHMVTIVLTMASIAIAREVYKEYKDRRESNAQLIIWSPDKGEIIFKNERYPTR